ncbi:MAG: MBL fold metallo-hydrolase [Asgard group archaeon]|nr:MBL fold metallo-hydrolase [Asgard group archaeon]
MKQLADNLFAITGKGIFSIPIFVVVKANGKLTLIDTGLAKDTNSIIKQIRKKWGSLENIERIAFTHRHSDHTQGLVKILEEMTTISAEAPPEEKIEIVVHEAEAPYFIEDLKEHNIKPNRLVKHEEYIDKEINLKAIHTPGHSFGHICMLFEDKKIILLGDIIMNMFGILSQVFKRFHDDYDQYIVSLPRILSFDWDFAVASHIKPKKIPRAKIERFIKRL